MAPGSHTFWILRFSLINHHFYRYNEQELLHSQAKRESLQQLGVLWNLVK